MCANIDAARVIERSENGRTFLVKNPRRRQINVVQVDGCLISPRDESRRVDWLIDIPNEKKFSSGIASVKLIELKGNDVLYAFSQLIATMNHENLTARLPFIDRCFVVSQQKPSLQSVVQNEIARFKLRFGVVAEVVPKAVIEVDE